MPNFEPDRDECVDVPSPSSRREGYVVVEIGKVTVRERPQHPYISLSIGGDPIVIIDPSTITDLLLALTSYKKIQSRRF